MKVMATKQPDWKTDIRKNGKDSVSDNETRL